MTSPIEYARANAERFRQDLHALLRIPSVSATPELAGEVRRAGQWLVDEMTRIGFPSVELVETAGHPIVYGEWLTAGADAPTILLYGHYDVQPADRVKDNWDSEPFEPIEKDGKIIARGSTDDKGPVVAHLKAIESIIQTTGALPVNLKVIFEGEEEVSSLHLGAFVSANLDRLKADACLISDTSIYAPDIPSIVYSLRGLVYMELHVQGPKDDLHSGVYGGTVHNPAQALAEIITQLHNPDGSVAVSGFYDEVQPLSDEERAALAKVPWRKADWAMGTGLELPWGEAQYSLRERVGARPTLEINGMASGFYGEGAKTVLPAKAMAKISCRLVADQDPRRIYERVRDFVASITPATVKSEVRLLHTGDAALVDRHSQPVQAAVQAYKAGWGGAEPVFVREGGSIPIVANFQRDLGIPVVLMGFGLDTDGAHGPNEHFHVERYHKGIETIIHFYSAYADLFAAGR
ncbi:MAG: dipeptidase [Anaerolineae bacterium]|jgi:acetylornithine deacetylase/succinyl-diaminopimelate desuccinylase-like protein|nr:dipeptidase [Anaerolineae bacterium]